MSFLSRHKIFLSIFFFLPVLACDPCRTLADKICECEETSGERDQCRKSLDFFSNTQSFGAASKEEVCREALKNEDCSCLAIRNGQYEACGMTR